MTSGYKVLLTKATSKHQGGIALFWQPDHEGFEVEATRVVTPNLITFQLVTGDKQYYVMGRYLPPNDTGGGGGDDLQAAWEACPANFSAIVMGELNINVEHPRDEREATIAGLLDKINLVDTSRKFTLRQCSLQKARKRWTWRQTHRGRWIYSQPDYIMAREGGIARLRKVGFQSPPIHDSNHCAVVAHMRRGRDGSLKIYQQNCQCFPITLPPGEQDEMTCQFEELKATIVHPGPKHHPRNDWISMETWRLVANRMMLHRTGRLCRAGGRRMKRGIWAALKTNRIARPNG